jgi:hypothetical protein
MADHHRRHNWLCGSSLFAQLGLDIIARLERAVHLSIVLRQKNAVFYPEARGPASVFSLRFIIQQKMLFFWITPLISGPQKFAGGAIESATLDSPVARTISLQSPARLWIRGFRPSAASKDPAQHPFKGTRRDIADAVSGRGSYAPRRSV